MRQGIERTPAPQPRNPRTTLAFSAVDLWFRVAGAAVLALFLLLVSGCAGDDAPTAQDRADALHYVAAAKEFSRASSTDARAADLRSASTFYECTLVRLGVPGLPPLSKLAVISLVAYYRAVLPAYGRFAHELTSVGAQDATLRDVAQAAQTLKAGYGRLQAARPDYCHTLRAWQKIGWTKPFGVLRAIGVDSRWFTATGIPRAPAVQRAERTIAASGDRLRELGVSEPDVVTFILATDAYAAARGGYTELVRLAHE